MATITVTFNPNGGTVTPETKTVTVGSSYGVLPTPTKAYNTFKGWATSTYRGETVTASTTVTKTEDHTLYATWAPERFTMSFNANGGTVNPSYKTVEKTCMIGWLPTPVRTGYVFQQWNTAANGSGTTYNSRTVVPGTGYPTTLYAVWKGETHTVTFDINDGILSIRPSCKTRTYTYGQTFGSFVGRYDWGNKNGQEFEYYPWWVLAIENLIGWFDKPVGGTQYKETDVCTLLRDTTLYAHWRPPISHVTFKLDGGTYNGSTEDFTWDYILTDGVGHIPFGRMPKPTREGSVFKGWRTIPDDRVVYDELTPHSKWPYQRAEWLRSDKYNVQEMMSDYSSVQMIDRYRVVKSNFVWPFRAGGTSDPDYIPYYDTYREGEGYMCWMNGFEAQGDLALFADWTRYEITLDH